MLSHEIASRLYHGNTELAELTARDILNLIQAHRLQPDGSIGLGMPIVMRYDGENVRVVNLRPVHNSHSWYVRIKRNGRFQWFELELEALDELGAPARHLRRSSAQPIFLRAPERLASRLVAVT